MGRVLRPRLPLFFFSPCAPRTKFLRALINLWDFTGSERERAARGNKVVTMQKGLESPCTYRAYPRIIQGKRGPIVRIHFILRPCTPPPLTPLPRTLRAGLSNADRIRRVMQPHNRHSHGELCVIYSRRLLLLPLCSRLKINN